MKRPNVLILYTDQQRWDTIAAAGYAHMHTPNLDALAARGVLFRNAFCNNPVCMPSRQSMLSGQYPMALGTGCNGIEMAHDVPTLATVLKPYGYVTGNFGKLHFLNHASRDHRVPHPSYGFDELAISDEPGCYEDAYIAWVRSVAPDQVDSCRCATPPAWEGTPVAGPPRNTQFPYPFEGPEHLTHSAFVAEHTIDFIRRQKDRAWFAIAGFYAPHCPLSPPQSCADLYKADELPDPLMTDEQRKNLGLSDEQWREVRRWYYALVTHVDQQAGRILDALDELGLRDDTLVIFTSDHGEHLGDHGRVQKGPPGHDSCVHVPLIVAGPGIAEPGRQSVHLTESVDIAPTILAACGIQVPPVMRGRSFYPDLSGGEYAPRRSTYLEFHDPTGPTTWRHVRTSQWKYCLGNHGQEILYDLANDPGELVNVVDSKANAAILSELRREMITRIFDADRCVPVRTGRY